MAFSWVVSPEILQIGKVSGGLCGRLNSNYRIVTDRRKGQSVLASLTRRTVHDNPRRASDTISSRLHEQKKPDCELHYFDRKRVALFHVHRIVLTGGTFKPIGGSQAPRRCLSSEAAAR
jgi:hypothetical protein